MEVTADSIMNQYLGKPASTEGAPAGGEGGAAAAEGAAAGSEDGSGEGSQGGDNANIGTEKPGEGGGAGAAAADNGGTPPAGTAAPAATPVVEDAELGEDAILKYLRDKKGFKGDNLDELIKPKTTATPTKEELEKQENDLVEKSIRFGLEKNIFDSKKLEAYNVDKNKSPRDIAYDVFAKNQKSADKDIADNEIEARFNSYYGLDREDGDWYRATKAKEMEALSEEYMKVKYPEILNIKESYRQDQDLATQATAYRDTVEKVTNEFPQKLSWKIKDEDGEHEYGIVVKPEELQKVKDKYLTPEIYERLTATGEVTPELLNDAIEMRYLKDNLPKILDEFAKSYYAERVTKEKAGRQGVLPEGTGGSGAAPVVHNGRAEEIIKNTLG